MQIGILALQGAVQPHQEKLKSLGVSTKEVRVPKDLEGLSGIILPGGESTSMVHLLKLNQLWEPLQKFLETHSGWGICAGAILMAKKVTNPNQASLKVFNIEAVRNAYGRQSESFETSLLATSDFPQTEAVFIRAPHLNPIATSVKTLLKHDDRPVLLEEGIHLVSSFHPELTDSKVIHEYFLKKCRNNSHE